MSHPPAVAAGRCWWHRPLPVTVALAAAVPPVVLAALWWPGGAGAALVAALGLAVVAGHAVSGSV